MADLPALHWSQADSQSIQTDEKSDAWHSGIVKDILVRPDGSLIVATDTGSIWSVGESGTGTPLNDTDKPDMWFVTNGIDGSDHIYAGGEALFETDVSQPLPLMSWSDISFNGDTIFRAVVVSNARRIVVATSSGVYWSDIPPAPNSSGCLGVLLGGLVPRKPRAPYKWNPAQGLPNGAYAGLAFHRDKGASFRRSSLPRGALERSKTATMEYSSVTGTQQKDWCFSVLRFQRLTPPAWRTRLWLPVPNFPHVFMPAHLIQMEIF